MKDPLPFQPVIILGAARTGTNILRDVMTHFDGLETWPCDEISAIWRYGNTAWPNDAMPAVLATKPVRYFIRQAFLRQWRRRGRPRFLVEKTCANTLRVDFVRAVLPEAKFIHLQRNGADVAASAMKRWSGEFELNPWRYYLAKLAYVPWANLPQVATQFTKRRFQRGAHYKAWGPIPDWMPMEAPLEFICARQWASCALRCAAALEKMPQRAVHHVTYEDLTSTPMDVLQSLFAFLDHQVAPRETYETIRLIRRPGRTSVVQDCGLDDVLETAK